ncbi:MAG: hypothetical protein KJ648_02095, partial [Candidatus Omnitrophica bacterium]|nr:hypothetical protein [Candidatus Omnitrophota bacterium]
RMTMAHSIELRCPFLDKEIIKFAFSTEIPIKSDVPLIHSIMIPSHAILANCDIRIGSSFRWLEIFKPRRSVSNA